MKISITSKSGYLVVQVFGLETAEEKREFLRAAALESRTCKRSRILFDVRASRPLFHIDRLELFDYFKELYSGPPCKIALLGDSLDLCISNEYFALVAPLHGLNVRSFRDRAQAFDWLNEQFSEQERRQINGVSCRGAAASGMSSAGGKGASVRIIARKPYDPFRA